MYEKSINDTQREREKGEGILLISASKTRTRVHPGPFGLLASLLEIGRACLQSELSTCIM